MIHPTATRGIEILKSKDFKENPVMAYNISILNWDIAIGNRKCPTCGMELLEKDDWIFCPKNSTEIPDCDSLYHIAKNIKTGQGWSTLDA